MTTTAKIPDTQCCSCFCYGKPQNVCYQHWLGPRAFFHEQVASRVNFTTGKSYTFWGKGVSQGHSDAIRRIKGVKKAVQYTIPVQESLKKVRDGEMPDLTTREKHRRECFVVVEEGADKEKISHEIKTMPAYFKDYETKVTFISEEEFMRDHTGMPHGGFVIHSGRTGAAAAHNQVIEFSSSWRAILSLHPAFLLPMQGLFID